MSIADWLKSCFSRRQRALALYRRGMAKAKKQDYAGAILDYSASLETPGIPPDVKAMALYNRALAYSAMEDDTKAAEDLAVVLEMPRLPENIKTAANQRRERIRRRHQGTDNHR